MPPASARASESVAPQPSQQQQAQTGMARGIARSHLMALALAALNTEAPPIALIDLRQHDAAQAIDGIGKGLDLGAEPARHTHDVGCVGLARGGIT